MKRQRIFIAINLPENIKKKLAEYQKKWPELPIRWTKPENLHITLDFIGYVADEELLEVCKKTKEIADKHNFFEIKLTRICYGPLRFRSGQAPRMVWAIGEKIKELNLSPHITLGRIRKWEWQRIEPEERPSVDEEIDLNFSVDSIELMESVLKKGGPEYTILESFKLDRGPTSI